MPAPSSCAEAGFSLIEALAALTIVALTVVAAMQVFGQSARVDARLAREAAATDLARRLFATGETGSGVSGALSWSVAVTPDRPGLRLRQVHVGWTGGGALDVARLEPVQ